MSENLARQISRMFSKDAPSSIHAVLDREPQDRDDFFGDGEEYYISEPPPYYECDDIKLDDHGDPYVDVDWDF